MATEQQPSPSRPPRPPLHPLLRAGRRIAIALAGGVVILVGLVLSIPLIPGPGAFIVVVGLAILSLEFERPRRWLATMKAKALELKHRWDGRRGRRARGS